MAFILLFFCLCRGLDPLLKLSAMPMLLGDHPYCYGNLLLKMIIRPGQIHLGDQKGQLELVNKVERHSSSIALSSDHSSDDLLTIQNKLKRVRLSSELEKLENGPIKRRRMTHSLQKAHFKELSFQLLNLPAELRNYV